ncbi:CPBP family intramembrane glutamic endopeptidase [Natronosalvus vescus]|uniref:CPBP family intramembrane glutamic endopeptidase n=1 Tax=Natronosalvus vescus TaxID=2953881 RepID=UPI002090DF32|nr:CPBP family intramembrane glutamic endopeptidase [Natronosalvus vescus]
MNETARDDHTRSSETGAMTGLGLGFAAVAMAGMAVPVQQGVDDPVVVSGLLLAVGALLVFGARRYDVLERRYSPVSALCSFGVVLLAGYALNQGINGTTTIPVVGGTIPAVFVAFLAAAIAIGIALAEYGSVSIVGLSRRVALTVHLSLLALVAWLVALFAGQLLAVPFAAALGGLTENQFIAISQVGFAIGTAAIAVGYVYTTDRDWSFFDLRWPTLRQMGWIAGGIGLIFLVNIALSILFSSSGVEGAEHSATQAAQQNPELLYVMIPASILIVGPFEELLYRNVIQKSMYDIFSRWGALLVSSVIFAVIHVAAYATAGFGAIMASLAVVFGLSLVLGTVYLLTENLVVPAIIHGIYNAIIFASLVL